MMKNNHGSATAAAVAREDGQLNVLGENRILEGLPSGNFRRLTRSLERVTLTVRTELYVPDRKIEYVYFPLSGVMSVVVDLNNGGHVEVGTVGNEGMLGMPVVHGAAASRFRAFAQVTGAALRMKTSAFLRAMISNAAF